MGAQVEGDSTPVPAYYTPFDHEATYYERVTTPRFSADTDDIFMRSMIEAYALEERTKVTEHSDGLKTGGGPSGKFWMNQASALAPPRRSSPPIRVSPARCSTTTPTPTSPRPGDISMSTRLVSSRSSETETELLSIPKNEAFSFQ